MTFLWWPVAVSDNFIHKAVIDTGPLFSALVSNFNILDIERSRPMRRAGVLDKTLQSEPAQRTLLRRLRSIPAKLTTSHVIGELQGLQNSRLSLFGEDLVSFWQESIDLLRQWNLGEELIRLLQLASDESSRISLPRIGPTDSGLISLALLHRCVLITEDEKTLMPEALNLGVDCWTLKRLVPFLD